MESKLLVILLIVLFLSLVFVSGAGCQQEKNTTTSAEDLDSELNNLENMNQELNDLELNMDESDFENLEDIL